MQPLHLMTCGQVHTTCIYKKAWSQLHSHDSWPTSKHEPGSPNTAVRVLRAQHNAGEQPLNTALPPLSVSFTAHAVPVHPHGPLIQWQRGWWQKRWRSVAYDPCTAQLNAMQRATARGEGVARTDHSERHHHCCRCPDAAVRAIPQSACTKANHEPVAAARNAKSVLH